MTFHFAWAGADEISFGPEHQVEDEEVFAFTLEHSEGDFATLAIDIRNPRRQYLAEGADLWMWLSEDGTPLFFGRLVAVPEDLHAEIVRLNFIARPTGYDVAKRALADTLRVRPNGLAAEAVIASARSRGYNLRDFGDGTVGISLDEAATRDDVEALIESFAGGSTFRLNVDELASADLNQKSEIKFHRRTRRLF